MKSHRLNAPFLKRIVLQTDKVDRTAFPFNHLPFLRKDGFAIEFAKPVTMLVGENGAGKSTLIEAIAAAAGFPALGGSQDHRPSPDCGGNTLASTLRLSWLPKISNGF